MKIAVYTAIFGDYDNLIQLNSHENCDFICFTDNKKLKSNLYEIRYVEREFSDPTRDARKIKTLSHLYLPDYEYTIWLDANIAIKASDIRKLLDVYLKKNDVAMHQHHMRSCVFDELETCVELDVDNHADMVRQVVSYLHDGYPPRIGLHETGVIFRRKTDNTVKFNEFWWENIKKFSKRDQLSVDYSLWKNKLRPFTIQNSIRDSKDFELLTHKKNTYHKRKKALMFNDISRRLNQLEVHHRETISRYERSLFWKAKLFSDKIQFVVLSPRKFVKKYKNKLQKINDTI